MVPVRRAATLRLSDAVVGSVSACASGIAALVSTALAVLLAVLAWNQVWVLRGAGTTGTAQALLVSAELIAAGLPLILLLAHGAALCLWDGSIGANAATALRMLVRWSAGTPPVLAGLAIFFLFALLQAHTAPIAALASLLVFNVPRFSVRLLRVFRMAPLDLKEAAQACGASPLFTFVKVILPAVAQPWLAMLLLLVSEMLAQVAAIIAATGALASVQPLAVVIWHFGSDTSLMRWAAMQSVVLVALIWLFSVLSETVARRRKATGFVA